VAADGTKRSSVSQSENAIFIPAWLAGWRLQQQQQQQQQQQLTGSSGMAACL
jgi:hypothetical protein